MAGSSRDVLGNDIGDPGAVAVDVGRDLGLVVWISVKTKGHEANETSVAAGDDRPAVISSGKLLGVAGRLPDALHGVANLTTESWK